MGWFQRLFSGANNNDLHRNRSSNQAPASAELSEELRALKEEITLLRGTLGGEDSPLSSEGSARDNGNRNRRGGRNASDARNTSGSRDDNRSRNTRTSRNTRSSRNGEPRKPRERKLVPDDAPVGLLVDYLKKLDIWVYEGQDDLNRNEAFEHLARHLGVHFKALSPFYEKLKRCVANGRGQRIDIDQMSQSERSAAVQFGTLLHRHGMLKDFYYHRAPKKQLRVIPTKDGEIAQFLTGGWLEIFVSAIMGKRLRASISPAKFQLMYNVKGSFSDGREFEADLMACVDGRLVWIECKTGHWQDYSARFKGLVKTFGTDRTSAGLLLIRPPDLATCKRATDMLDMTLMSLDEVEDFISVFLGEELVGKPTPPEIELIDDGEERRSRNRGRSDRRSSSDSRNTRDNKRDDERRDERDERDKPQEAAEIPEEEIPLENVEAAKKLGHVNLDEDETPQRRRRRRGGRGRGGRSSASHDESEKSDDDSVEEKSATEESIKPKLVDPLPLTKFAKEESDESEKAEKPDAEESTDEPTDEDAPSAKKKVKRQPKRRGKPKADKPEVEEAADEVEVKPEPKKAEPKAKPAVKRKAEPKAKSEPKPEAVAPKPKPKPKPAPKATAVKSVSGTTIAPDLAAMMAGGAKNKTDDN